jgi:hypothetical protein
MMPSFVEKTLQVQSGLTHGTDKETPADFLKYPASRIIRPPILGWSLALSQQHRALLGWVSLG